MAITGPRGLLVQGPVLRPAKYGLLSVAQGPETLSDVHWEAGLEFEDLLCSPTSVTLPNCPGGVSFVKTPEPGPLFRMVDPFTVYGSFDCSVGGRPPQDAFDIARARLLASEYKSVEETFWTGVTPDGDLVSSLALGDVAAGISPTVLGTGPLSPVAAIAILENALGDCVPGTGVIHANYGLAAYLADAFLLTEENGVYYSPTGQAIAFGAGYPGSGPDNVPADPGETWIFGTGQVITWRSDVFMTPDVPKEAIDRAINDITVFAERTWAVGFSCCLFAVNVSLTCDCG